MRAPICALLAGWIWLLVLTSYCLCHAIVIGHRGDGKGGQVDRKPLAEESELTREIHSSQTGAWKMIGRFIYGERSTEKRLAKEPIGAQAELYAPGYSDEATNDVEDDANTFSPDFPSQRIRRRGQHQFLQPHDQIQLSSESAVHRHISRSLLSFIHKNKDPTRADEEEPEKYNLLIIPLIAFAAFVVFLCMRCCHWNQKDFRDRGVIIEHHHRKKNIAKGLIHTRFDGQSQRRLSCVPEQLMLLPLFLTGSARNDLNKVGDSSQDGAMEKQCSSHSDSASNCSSEPPSSDPEFDTPFPYTSPGRRRSSSVPPDLIFKGRFKKARSSSIIDIRTRNARRMSVVSAVSAKSTPQTYSHNHNPNLLSVTAELHEPPRSFSQKNSSGDVTPESIIYPLPSDSGKFPSEIRITRDVYVETKFREIGVDTSDLYPPPCLPLDDVNHSLYVIQHRKFARVRKTPRSVPTFALPVSRKRRRQADDETIGYVMNDTRTMRPRVHTSAVRKPRQKPVTVNSTTTSINPNHTSQTFNLQDTCDITPFVVDYNPFAQVSNGQSTNSSGHSLGAESDPVMLSLPPLNLSPISSNSEFYRRLCSSEDSALAKSPISEMSTEDRSTRDPLSRDGTLSPPPFRLNGRLSSHSKPNNLNNSHNMQNNVYMQIAHKQDDDMEHAALSRTDSGRYSDTSMTSRLGRGYQRLSSSEPRSPLPSVSSEYDDHPLTQPLLKS